MKKLTPLSFLALLGLLLGAATASAATRYSVATGNWNATSTWSATSGGASGASVPTTGDTVTVEGGHTVTVNANTASLGSLTISAGNTLSVSANYTVSATTITLNGTYVNNSTGTITVTTMTVGSSGTYQLNADGGTIPTATWSTGSTCAITGYATTTGNPTGYATSFGQSFANFTWNCPNQTGVISSGGALTNVNGNFTVASTGTGSLALGNNNSGNLAVGGNFSQTGGTFIGSEGAARTITIAGSFSLTSGTFNLSSSATAANAVVVDVAGNFTQTGGTLTETGSTTGSGIVFNGTSTQTYTSGGTVANTISFTVNSGATVVMASGSTVTVNSGATMTVTGTFDCGTGTAVSGAGSFVVTSAATATLRVGSVNGIVAAGTASGNIQTTTRTYNTGANYVYNGTAGQATGTGLPATVNNLTINNSGPATVTLGANIAVSGTLTIQSGTFNANAETVTVTGLTTVSGGTYLASTATQTLTGGLTVSGGTFTGSSGTVSAGTVTLSSGTLTAPTSSGAFNVSGNWSQTGGTFTPSGGTVTLNGTTQTIGGSTFNNLSLSGSGAKTFGSSPPTISGNLSIASGVTATVANNTTVAVNSLYLNGTQQVPNTWGGTGSGAVNINTTYFNPTTAGLLNVTSGASATRLMVTLPGQTFTGGSGNSGTVSSQTAGTAFNITLTAVDVNNNIDASYSGSKTVSYSGPANGPGGATPTCTTTVTFTAGQATSVATTLVDAQTTTITASISGLTGVASSSLTVSAGVVAQLAFTTQPGGGTGGTAWTTQPVVTVQDQYGNTVTTDTSTVTVAIGTNPGGGTLSGTLTKAAVAGVASFSTNALKIDKVGTGYTLTATDGALASATSSAFNITPGTAAKLAYTSVPTTGTAGTAFSVTVQSQDASGNPASPTSNTTITLSKATGGGTLSGTLTGTIATNGNSVTISTPAYSKADTMTLTATATAGMTGLTAVTSGNIVFSPGAATKLVFTSTAVTTSAGAASGTITVQRQDANGNPNTADAARTVTLSSSSTGTVTFNPTSLTISSGSSSATFTYTDTQAGTPTITAASTSPSTITSATQVETVNPATASKLVMKTEPPVSATAGGVFSTQPAVYVEDTYGNVVTTNGSTVTATVQAGTGPLTGTLTAVASSGVATFSGLAAPTTAQTGLKLTFTDGSLASAVDATSITVNPGAMSQLVMNPTTISSATAGTSVSGSFTSITAEDAYGNVCGSGPNAFTGTVTFGGTAGATGTSAAFSAGVLTTFPTLTPTVAGSGKTVTATSGSIVGTTTITTVNPGAAAKLVITSVNGGSNPTAGTAFSVVVQSQDANGNAANVVAGTGVSLSLNTGSGTLGGTLTGTITSGTSSVTISGVTYTKAESGVILAATRTSGDSLTAGNSSAFTVLPGALDHFAISAISSPQTAGTAITGITLTAQDVNNNTVTSFTTTVAYSGTAGITGTSAAFTSGVLSGVSVTPAVAGSGLTFIVTGSAKTGTATIATINPGAISSYAVSAAAATRGTAFNVTVAAKDANNNTVTTDSSTVVTMTGSSGNVLFDGNGDGTFGDSNKTLSGGTFTISTKDMLAETVTITATDANGKTGNASVTINAATGDYRSVASANWNVISTWQTWNGSSWVEASSTPTGAAGVAITLQTAYTVTNNVAVSLAGALDVQGTLSFSGSGAITVASGGIVRNSGTVNSSGTTLTFSSGATYEHNFTTTAGTIPTATWASGSACVIIGYTTDTSPPAGLGQGFDKLTWNCLGQSATVNVNTVIATVNNTFTVAGTGTGVLTLNAANTYAGATVLSGGTVQLGQSGLAVTVSDYSFESPSESSSPYWAYLSGTVSNWTFNGAGVAYQNASNPWWSSNLRPP